MKRFMQLLIALPIFSAMLCSCNDNDLDERTIVSINGLNDTYEFEAIPASDSKITFTIRSTVNWHLDLDSLDWVKVTPGRGLASSSAQTVTVEALPNADHKARKGVMTVVAGDVTREVTLSQKAGSLNPELLFVEGVRTEVSADGEELYIFEVEAYNIYGSFFKVYSNRDWKADATDMDEWANVGPTSGSKGRYATISVTPENANESGIDRDGKIVFDFGDDQTKTLIVRQIKFDPKITIAVNGTEQSKLEVLSLGDTFNVDVDANAEWTVTSSKPWAIPSLEDGEYGKSALTVTVEPNETGEERKAVISFVNGSLTKKVTITQKKEFISLSEAEFIATRKGGDFPFKISSNEPWTAVASEEWLKVTPATGNGSAKMVITIPAEEIPVRTATVTVKSDNNPEIYKVINITQTKYVDLRDTVLFNASQQKWNKDNNPDYASKDQTGAVTGKGTGRLVSYTDPGNDMIYAQVVNSHNFGMLYIMADEGNIAFKKIWAGDGIEFHIPALKVDKGSKLHFDYGFLGTSAAPKYWNTELRVNSGEWQSLATGKAETASNGAESNTVLPGKKNTEVYYNATYTFSKSVQFADLVIRITCVDGKRRNDGEDNEEAPDAGGTIRIIGADHQYKKDANKEGVVKGPKIYIEHE